ncbi:phospholipid-transporting ATPase ID-like isoform X2 [Eriocheir sinensis]|uniref:phospholipid-transporting ATPase ID-like isoform X2 n=1 Tax=Eriocheir sinensis TaxID=95602 RepID=UPI0021CA1F2B|nr:phospholipid-transporting ATPase ID-like isoform X2 [Eriocheir sinensis]
MPPPPTYSSSTINSTSPSSNPSSSTSSINPPPSTSSSTKKTTKCIKGRKKQEPEPETERHIIPNNPEFNAQFNYAKNYIKTSKYTLFNFVPYNLFEQFQRLANFYFLCLLVLQLIPVISSLSPITTAVPLIGVLTVTAVKDAYDDFQRHRSDRQVNTRKTWVLRNGQLVEESWSKVLVGDVIRMENDQFVAADILLLSTSEPNGLCYIETSELDGETNLKCKQCLPETEDLGQDDSLIGAFQGEIHCEPPNNQLNKFDGTLTLDGNTHSLDNDKILLRGCILRNTHWCYGVVIFAGKDTKLMMNSGKTKFKRTSIDRLLNFIILGIVFFLLSMCLFCTVACGIWETLTGQYFREYLPWDTLIPSDPVGGAAVIGLLIFFSYAIVLNTVVPISLYVSVEVIRLAQSFLINWDNEMYYAVTKTHAKARTTTLNEELGQIEYIFSDKTGTLTQNIMAFNKCSIAGHSFGEVIDPRTGEPIEITESGAWIRKQRRKRRRSTPNHPPHPHPRWRTLRNTDAHDEESLVTLLADPQDTATPESPGAMGSRGDGGGQGGTSGDNLVVVENLVPVTPPPHASSASSSSSSSAWPPLLDVQSVDLSDNPFHEPSFKFYDQTLVDALEVGDENCEGFFRLLALCHTVMPEEKNGKLEYQAQSPDEGALVSAARNFGFVFKSRTPNSITISAKKNPETYELLCILDFNNVRKRMSVILKKDGKIRLYCKGADSIIYERLKAGQEGLKRQTQEHLDAFAGDGLRTLCLAYKDLEENYFQNWKSRHHEAAVSLENRDAKLDAIYEEIEKDLLLMGATAIEDKLQDGVPQTIANLAVAGIKIWVLTGDKQETAINIGYSCQLLTDDMAEVFIIDAQSAVEVEEQLQRTREQIRNMTSSTHNQTSLSVVTFSEDALGPDMLSEAGEANSGYALIINGHSLVFALNAKYERLFLEVACYCKAVICCRVTPLQKAMVVDLVKRYKKAVTLAVGDGANDVSMIKTAHIGVGISGQEGLQAVLASDYSVAQFKFLERLLLVHGRWSYYRMCKFLRYFFYKNFAFTLCHFWFAFFVAFSAQTLFDPMFISVYNLFYTSMPVLALGIFEQDVSDRCSIKFPKLYTPGLKNALFNKREFFRSAVQGFVTSCVLFFIPFGAYYNAMDTEGRSMADQQTFGSVVATILVIVVTMQICLDTSYWTLFNHITIWGSLIFYLLLQYAYNYLLKGEYVGALAKAMGEPMFYFTTLLTIVILMLPVMAWRFYWVDVHPTLSDKVRFKQRHDAKLASQRTEHRIARTPSARRSRRSIRSGYAFAHQEGFGRLITSGKIMRPRNPRQGALSNGRANNPRSDQGRVPIVAPAPSTVEV